MIKSPDIGSIIVSATCRYTGEASIYRLNPLFGNKAVTMNSIAIISRHRTAPITEPIPAPVKRLSHEESPSLPNANRPNSGPPNAKAQISPIIERISQ
ncbi:hypothetical protein D3C77_586870 [compost metagenome]